LGENKLKDDNIHVIQNQNLNAFTMHWSHFSTTAKKQGKFLYFNDLLIGGKKGERTLVNQISSENTKFF